MAKDTYRLNGFNSVKLPKLKGHVKLTLHNCRTGKNEVVEGDNIITNAVRDIFLNNQLGGIDYAKLLPLWSKWFGGVLCYENAHPLVGGVLDPDDYYPQGDLINPVTAHAGQVSPQDLADDRKRGMPNTAGQVFSDGVVKQAWEWGSTQGNGNISALSLTHADVGDCGLGSTSNAFGAFAPFDLIQGSQLPASDAGLVNKDNLFARYDDNHGLFFTIGDVGDFYYGRHTSFATKKLTVYVRRLPYFKAGLIETLHADSDYQRVFTVETSGATMYAQPSYYFDVEHKYLWVFYNNTSTCGTEQPHWWAGTWDNNTVNYFVVDCENEEIIDEGTIVSSGNDLAPLSMPRSVGAGASDTDFYVNACIVKDGDYVYLPTGTINSYWTDYSNYRITGYRKIDITNQADQDVIEFNDTQNAFMSAVKFGGLIINSGRVVNGGVGYSCVSQLTESNRAFNDVHKPSFLAMPIGVGNQSGTLPRYIVANKMVNSSKFNLPSTVQKTSNQSMTVEYTLTEVGDES